MKVKITRIDKELPLPEYHTEGAVAFDLIARENVIIASREIALIPSNNIIQTPEGYALVLVPRSSMPKKTGLTFPHGIGIIDQDYCGKEDEVKIQVYNFTDHEVIISRGERIAQGIFVPIEIAEWEEIDKSDNPTRGGFGTTGTHAR